ncbi:hypothetical protein [Rickettsia endosymbiont of Seladonia tumulorum]|uniref:hypothetical protein n=1 Tax=Rickettsia endosymbiont of Seladonia tumulorum TaxID=3066270 RepID=UPI00313C6898
MPIENITKLQRQGQLFGYKLTEELNHNNKLYKLRSLINWSSLEEWLSANVDIKKYGSKIFGMTGTLGSNAEESLLSEIYKIVIGLIALYLEY